MSLANIGAALLQGGAYPNDSGALIGVRSGPMLRMVLLMILSTDSRPETANASAVDRPTHDTINQVAVDDRARELILVVLRARVGPPIEDGVPRRDPGLRCCFHDVVTSATPAPRIRAASAGLLLHHTHRRVENALALHQARISVRDRWLGSRANRGTCAIGDQEFGERS
jgi:hypothetical protein